MTIKFDKKEVAKVIEVEDIYLQRLEGTVEVDATAIVNNASYYERIDSNVEKYQVQLCDTFEDQVQLLYDISCDIMFDWATAEIEEHFNGGKKADKYVYVDIDDFKDAESYIEYLDEQDSHWFEEEYVASDVDIRYPMWKVILCEVYEDIEEIEKELDKEIDKLDDEIDDYCEENGMEYIETLDIATFIKTMGVSPIKEWEVKEWNLIEKFSDETQLLYFKSLLALDEIKVA